MTSNPEKSFKSGNARLSKAIESARSFVGYWQDRAAVLEKLRKQNGKLYDLAIYLGDRDSAYAICDANHAAIGALDDVMTENYIASIEAESLADRMTVRVKADRLIAQYGFLPEDLLTGWELKALRMLANRAA